MISASTVVKFANRITAVTLGMPNPRKVTFAWLKFIFPVLKAEEFNAAVLFPINKFLPSPIP